MGNYHPIGDYGAIGDGHTAALVSKHGSIDWCCFPDFDSPSVFARLLDHQRGGHFSICPVEPAEATQAYLEDTNVLTTLFTTPQGAARLTDFMPVPAPPSLKHFVFPLRQVIRLVQGVSGVIEMQANYEPRPSYGRETPRLRLRSSRSAVLERKGTTLQLLSPVPLMLHDGGASARFVLQAGETAAFALAYDEQAPSVFPAPQPLALRLLEETVAFWRGWLARCRYQGRYADAVRRSALTLKLLHFTPSGAIVGAPSTSLPEWKGGVRNWDYRYCWLRDATFTLEALGNLGFVNEAESFSSWLLHSTRTTHPRLRVLYTLFGEPGIKERELSYLEGYAGSRPVRIGNRAKAQYQLDVYGEVLDGTFRIEPEAYRLSSDARRLIAGAADYVANHWREADNGIWEMQGQGQFTHSKALSWVALDCALRLLARRRVSARRMARWQEEKARIAATVLDEGYNRELGTFTQLLGGRDLDAALLTLPLVGFIDPKDPRMCGTVKAVCETLATNGLVYRYRVPDGLPPGEGAFVTCSFWLAQCLALQGDIEEAVTTFERGLACANHLGLLAEEVDPHTLEALGNFPQGIAHVALINAAVAIARAEATSPSTARR